MQAELARQFQGKYGRAPNQRELLSIHRTARAATPESKAKGPIDFDQAARERGSDWTRRFGTPVAGLASHVSNMRGPSRTREASRERAPRDAGTVTRAAQVALDPDAAVALVNELTDRALVGEFEPAQCLNAREIVALPDELRRPRGRRSGGV